MTHLRLGQWLEREEAGGARPATHRLEAGGFPPHLQVDVDATRIGIDMSDNMCMLLQLRRLDLARLEVIDVSTNTLR